MRVQLRQTLLIRQAGPEVIVFLVPAAVFTDVISEICTRQEIIIIIHDSATIILGEAGLH